LSGEGEYFTADGGGTWTLVMAFIDTTSYAGSTHILPDGTHLHRQQRGDRVLERGSHHREPFSIYQASSLPVPQPRLLYQTGLSPAVMPLANSPSVTVFVDEGVSLYASNSPSGNTATSSAFWTAPLSSTTEWTQMPDSTCVGTICRPSNEMAYDPINHIVYGANWGSGLFRLVTRWEWGRRRPALASGIIHDGVRVPAWREPSWHPADP
jgi:hypothetical protein